VSPISLFGVSARPASPNPCARTRADFLDEGAAEYVGVDASEGMLAQAPRLEGARFVHGDIARLPGGLGAFDLVFVCLVLEHLEDVGPVLRAAARANRPGGRFRAYGLHAARRRAGTCAHFRLNDGRQIELASFAHDAQELSAGLEAAGYDDLATRDWCATPDACARCTKLARYAGEPVLIEVSARRSTRPPT